MKIIIDYDSAWRNSFLDGDNNEPVPKKGRKFIGSMTNLKKAENFIKRSITHDTVMGLLNRVIGDQRKLYQSREDDSYYFKDVEGGRVVFQDKAVETNEMTYIRNITPNTYDKKAFTGAINVAHPLLSSDYSLELWGILNLSFEKNIQFILGEKSSELKAKYMDPLQLSDKAESFKDIKIDVISEKENVCEIDLNKVVEYLRNDESINLQLKNQFPSLKKTFADIDYIKNEKIVVRALYCSSLYLQAIRLSEKYDMKNVVLKGFSVNGFTPKDFMTLFTGGKKKVYGNPYIHEEFIKGEGKTKHLMTKASGQLEINIDVSRDKAKEIAAMIENAGVSSFYLGKKGLAYISSISTREMKK